MSIQARTSLPGHEGAVVQHGDRATVFGAIGIAVSSTAVSSTTETAPARLGRDLVGVRMMGPTRRPAGTARPLGWAGGGSR